MDRIWQRIMQTWMFDAVRSIDNAYMNVRLGSLYRRILDLQHSGSSRSSNRRIFTSQLVHVFIRRVLSNLNNTTIVNEPQQHCIVSTLTETKKNGGHCRINRRCPAWLKGSQNWMEAKIEWKLESSGMKRDLELNRSRNVGIKVRMEWHEVGIK